MVSLHLAFPPLTGCGRLASETRLSTSVFVDLEISTYADEAQSSRVPVPFLEDPYEAIRQACLVKMDIESKPFEDPVETETPESPYIVASLTSLPDSTPTTCHAEETARMVVRVPPMMSPGLSASIAEPSRGTSELAEDEEEEDEEVEESLDFDSESEDAEDKGPTVDDEGPAAGDEGLAAGSEGLVTRERGEHLGLGYRVLRRQEIASREGQIPNVFEVAPSTVPSPTSSSMIPLTISSTVASPTTAKAEGFLAELGDQIEMREGLIHDHMITDERRARLDLAEIVASMRKGQEPRGNV
uniref:Uncharacterized protein n=1 Tax=Tanacetum cinerariifolium TaxID=118510 RepID=A0A699H4Y0_TANCI|nr:hypothetical protein [Tanacetum cinerariifolium]